MTFNIVYSDSEVDLIPYMTFSTFDGKLEMISGGNAGRSIAKTRILDDLGYEKHFSFNSRMLTNEEAILLETYFSQRPFTIITDYFSSNPMQYQMTCDSISKVVVNSGPSERVKISGEFVEL